MKVVVSKQRTGGRGAYDFYDALVEVESMDAAMLKGQFCVLSRGRFFWQLGAERSDLDRIMSYRPNPAWQRAIAAIQQAFPGLEDMPGHAVLRYQIRTEHQGPDRDEREIEFDHPIHREAAS